MSKRILSKAVVLILALLTVFSSLSTTTCIAANNNNVLYYHNGHTYKIFTDSLNWKDAAASCVSAGGHLATITTEEEQKFVASILEGSGKNCYWIGGVKEDNTWTWVTGEEFKYTKWASNEPNNDENRENYIHVFGKKYTGGKGTKYIGDWNDASEEGAGYAGDFYASSNYGYVCEWEEIFYQKGDVNKDGKINIKDATAIQKHLAKLIELDDEALELADFDDNRKVSVRDATAIQKFIAGIN